MDFGVFNVLQQRHREMTSAAVLKEAIEHSRAADDLGFSRVWFAEHHFSNYSLCPSPLVMCAHVAGVTKRIRVGTAVIIAPLHHPARLTAEIGMVDTMSDGRLDVGFGSGYQPYEFERLGVDIKENKERFHEILDMVELGLRNPHFTYRGKHYDQKQTAISVRSVQQPRPPIWIAGNDPLSHRRCARDGYIPFISGVLGSANRIRRIRDQVDQAYREEGVDPEGIQLGVLRFAHVSNDRRAIERYVDSARYQQRIAISLRERREVVVDDYMIAEEPFPEELPLDRIEKNLMLGDPETVAERVCQEIELYKPTHMNIYFSVGDVESRDAIRSMELFATRVVPLVEKHFGKPLAEINPGRPPVPKRAMAAE